MDGLTDGDTVDGRGRGNGRNSHFEDLGENAEIRMGMSWVQLSTRVGDTRSQWVRADEMRRRANAQLHIDTYTLHVRNPSLF